jgi:RNA polymerase sigma factor (sigma-70 family)
VLPSTPDDRLSRISTLWTLVQQAHGSPVDVAEKARQTLVERYAGAVHRYFLGAVRDADLADDLLQEFFLRFVRGDFKNVCPERGRFRDYLRTAAIHLVTDHFRRPAPLPPLPPDVPGPAAAPPSESDAERQFRAAWRETLMERTWQALAQWERDTSYPHHTVLRLRAEAPLLSSQELAQRVGSQLGRSFTVAAIRQALHRAREKFTELLLDEVARSLDKPSRSNLEAELLDLELLNFCRSALVRRRGGSS